MVKCAWAEGDGGGRGAHTPQAGFFCGAPHMPDNLSVTSRYTPFSGFHCGPSFLRSLSYPFLVPSLCEGKSVCVRGAAHAPPLFSFLMFLRRSVSFGRTVLKEGSSERDEAEEDEENPRE